jgi:hypothetical protein
MSIDDLKKLDDYQSAIEAAAAKLPIPKIPLDQNISLSSLTPEINEWYWCAKCDECGRIVAMTYDTFHGQSPQPLADAGGEFDIACPFCHNHIVAKGNDIFAHRWTPQDHYV